MNMTLSDVEFETHTIGPLVLTTPCLHRLRLREIINRLCPVAEQADFDHGLVAELVVQCRLTAPRALYDMPGWAAMYDIATLYSDVDDAKQLNDDRVGRLLDAIYPQRAILWGEVVARAARAYALDLSRLHADTMPIKFAGLFAEQSGEDTVPRLEPGYNPQGEWVQQLKLFALATGDGGLPVWFDALSGGAGDSPNYVPQFEALGQHEAQRRQAEMSTIEAKIRRIQGLVNKYDYKTPEIIVRRVQEKAFKKRAARHYFDIAVVAHPERPEALYALHYTIDQGRVARDALLDGVYLLVAGGPAAQWDDASLLQEWKGQYTVEHCFRLTNQLFLCGPVFLKNAQRIVSLILLIMVGWLVAGLLERQIRWVLG